jgi:putative membrane protein
MDLLEVVGPGVAVIGVVGYLWLVARIEGRRWPRRRSIAWITGNASAAGALSGPLAVAADTSYVAHMLSHLLVAMAAPLLLVLGAPITLLLRTLPTSTGRQLSHLLRRRPVRVVTEPLVAASLNLGGLWLLYTTPLYEAMHRNAILHVAVHVHMFLAGYLFASTLVGIDPLRHRGYAHRAGVLVVALGLHDILAKYLYAHPPAGIDQSSAHTGAMVMYYGGDVVDLTVAVLLCAAWYRTTRPRATSRVLAA